MRYEYYKDNKIKTSFLKKYRWAFLVIFTAISIFLGFKYISFPTKLESNIQSEEAFYEGYFSINSQLDNAILNRFPDMSLKEANSKNDGIVSHTFNLPHNHTVNRDQIRRFLLNATSGYGFRVESELNEPLRWEYYILSDTTLWVKYIFEIGNSEYQSEANVVRVTRKSEKKPQICLVIDDFGYSNAPLIKEFLNFKTPLTYAIIPERSYSTLIANSLRLKDKEYIIHMPMVTITQSTSEPNIVLADSLSSNEIEERLLRAMISVPGAKGMNNHQGSGATQSVNLMKMVANFIKEKDFFFVDSRTISTTVAETVMREQGVRTGNRKVFIDESSDEMLIEKAIYELAELAKNNGKALGIGHCRPHTLAVLKRVIPKLIDAGYEFVTASQIVE